MAEIRRMNEKQFRRAKRLIRSLCANCDEGNCLLLDDGETCICPQRITYSVLCRYFREAVLPAEKELYAEIMLTGKLRRCAECRQSFLPPKHNTLYCPSCAQLRARRSKRDWARRNKAVQ
jgi:hypothetical protein